MRTRDRVPFSTGVDSIRTLGESTNGMAIVDDVGTMRLRAREQLLQGASQIKLVASGGVSSPRSPLDIATFSQDELSAGVAVAASSSSRMQQSGSCSIRFVLTTTGRL